MSWNINLVDTWGKDVQLNTNNGFQDRILKASSTWAKLWKDNGIVANDGETIELYKVLEVEAELLKDAFDVEEAMRREDDGDVADYLRKIVRVARKYGKDGNDRMALTFL